MPILRDGREIAEFSFILLSKRHHIKFSASYSNFWGKYNFSNFQKCNFLVTFRNMSVTTFYPQPIFYPANYLSTFSKFPAPGKNSAAFVKKMSDFAIKRNHNVKEGLKLLVTLVYLNQNYINHDYVCSTTQLKFYAPPSFWMFFHTSQLGKF